MSLDINLPPINSPEYEIFMVNRHFMGEENALVRLRMDQLGEEAAYILDLGDSALFEVIKEEMRALAGQYPEVHQGWLGAMQRASDDTSPWLGL